MLRESNHYFCSFDKFTARDRKRVLRAEDIGKIMFILAKKSEMDEHLLQINTDSTDASKLEYRYVSTVTQCPEFDIISTSDKNCRLATMAL